MPTHKRIDITIGEEGEVIIEPVGFRGPECQKATEAIEQALGPVTARFRTNDYFKQPQTQRQERLA